MSSINPSAPDDLRVGTRIPLLEMIPTMEDVVRWAAAGDDYTPFHFDTEVARTRGFEGPVVHGSFKAGEVAGMLTEGLGPRPRLQESSCRYRRPVIVWNPLICSGQVTAIDTEGADWIVSFDIQAESPAGDVATTGTAIVRIPGNTGAVSLITDELLAAFEIGEVVGRYTFEVTTERILRFASVLDDLDLGTSLVYHGDPVESPQEAPTTFFAALDPLELRIMPFSRGLDSTPHRRTGGGNAFNEIEYERPIRAGDIVTVEVAYTDVYERSGRSGLLLFRIRGSVLTDQQGERIGVARSGHVYAFDVAGYEPQARSKRVTATEVTDEGEELPPLTRVPTTQTLVRYAAASDDYAPLHYDHNYARARGYDGGIVHGVLKAVYLATMGGGWAGPGAFVKRFRAEYRGPDYPDLPITARGRVVRSFEEEGRRAADVSLWIERADGSVSTKGSATVLFPS